jgi:hypothetical protein
LAIGASGSFKKRISQLIPSPLIKVGFYYKSFEQIIGN